MLNEAGPVLSWKSKKQQTVALSSCEAEYVAMSASCQEAVYLGRLLEELLQVSFEPVTINADNTGAMSLAKNPTHHDRSKHIDIKYHYVRDLITRNEINVIYCPSNNMIADLFTKGLPRVQYELLRGRLGVHPSNVPKKINHNMVNKTNI